MVADQQLVDEFVRGVFAHVDVDQTELAPLLKQVNVQDYPRKSSLLRAEDQWDRLFYVQRGLIRLFYLDYQGREFNKAFFREGQCIWPVAPQDRNEGILFNVSALETTTVVECPFAPLHAFLKEQDLWEKFALPFAETLVEQKFQREHDLLLLSAAERLAAFARKNSDLVDRIPDYHLASLLGVSNVTLSRVKKKVLTNANEIVI